MDNAIIKVEGVSKVYKLYNKPIDRLKESFSITGKKYHKAFYALKDVNFKIKKGETVGIIGKNGSGKSTLLKIITSIISETSGKVEVEGRISAIIELGAGFNPEYSGIQNIYLNGIMMGLTKEQIDLKLDEIIKFADIGDFIKQPVKTYSSGMYARLAFSVAINVDPDILIVDEALSVGDMSFQHKCMNKMNSLKENGLTIIFVSHDPHAIKSLCTRCIYLSDGGIKAIGNAGEIVDFYLKDMKESLFVVPNNFIDNKTEIKEAKSDCDIDEIKRFNIRNDIIRFGTGGAKIVLVKVTDQAGSEKDHFCFDETINVKVYADFYDNYDSINCCLLIKDKNGIDITGTTTFDENIKFETIKKGKRALFTFQFKNMLKHDTTYSVNVSLNNTYSYENQIVLDCIEQAKHFKSVYNPKRPVWYVFHESFKIDMRIFE